MKTLGAVSLGKLDSFKGWAISDKVDVTPEILVLCNSSEVTRVKADIYRKDIASKKGEHNGHCGFEVKNFNEILRCHNLLHSRDIKVQFIISQSGKELKNSPIELCKFTGESPFIFVHIPKTGGTSFRLAAKRKLACMWDYGFESGTTTEIIKQTFYKGENNSADELRDFVYRWQIKFISGHFSAQKYKEVFPDGKLLTFVRNPIFRVVSAYNHAIRHGVYADTIYNFCKKPKNQNLMSRCFSGFGEEDFFFIGVTEKYENSLQKFNVSSELNLPYLKTNMASSKPRNPLEISKENLDQEVIEVIQEYNQDDISLYEKIVRSY